MSVSAAEIAADSLSLQAESSPALGVEGTADESNAPAPRRGARTRKPTAKAAGLDATETTEQPPARTARKRKADDLNAEKEHTTIHSEADADRIDQEVNEVFEGGEGDEGEEDDERQYCICRGKDDGTFMISCERCQEWLVASIQIGLGWET